MSWIFVLLYQIALKIWTEVNTGNRQSISIQYWIRKWINFNAKIQILANRFDILYFCTKRPKICAIIIGSSEIKKTSVVKITKIA